MLFFFYRKTICVKRILVYIEAFCLISFKTRDLSTMLIIYKKDGRRIKNKNLLFILKSFIDF